MSILRRRSTKCRCPWSSTRSERPERADGPSDPRDSRRQAAVGERPNKYERCRCRALNGESALLAPPPPAGAVDSRQPTWASVRSPDQGRSSSKLDFKTPRSVAQRNNLLRRWRYHPRQWRHCDRQTRSFKGLGEGCWPSVMTMPAEYSRSQAASRASSRDIVSKTAAPPPSDVLSFSQAGHVIAS